MTCAMHSGQCHPVELLDGSPSCSWSEAWRHLCEARQIYTRTLVDDRRAMLEKIESTRGRQARARLEETLLAIHQGARRARTGHE